MAHGEENDIRGETVTRYVPCRVEPGMFRGEYLVYLEAGTRQNPEEAVRVQLLVDSEGVAGLRGTPARHRPAEAFLQVEVADSTGDYAVVVLPQPAQPVGETVLVAWSRLREEVAA
jgi:hypothetical protein